MEDPDQLQIMVSDPLEGIVLFLRIHPKAYRTLVCIAYPEHSLNQILLPGQQPTGFERRLGRNVPAHHLQVFGSQFQDFDHINEKG